jgi:hypothetical protein
MKETIVPLKPGYYFAPGFYMDYWINGVLKNFDHKIVATDTRFQKHREMVCGAILAAANSIAGPKIKTFVGLNEDTHPDLDLAYYVKEKLPGGVEGYVRKHIYVEQTRCNIDEGEDIVEQILKKNTPENKGIMVAVSIFGYGKSEPDKVHKILAEQKEIYPAQIVEVASISKAGTIYVPKDSYGINLLWPNSGSTMLNLNDPKAFFRNPDVLPQNFGRKTGYEEVDLGKFTLQYPVLKT